jgi:hypothetical protein
MSTDVQPIEAVVRTLGALRRPDLLVRAYFRSRDLVGRYFRVVMAIFTGFWLGILSRPQFERVDDLAYEGERKRHNAIDYLSEAHNRQGLFAWEVEALERYFPERGRLALLGAGAGREVLALKARSYDVEAWECQPAFVAFANDLLARDGHDPAVTVVPRDVVPEGPTGFDGLIIGWGTYTLVPGRHRRIALLRSLREKVEPGTPILCSFYVRRAGETRFAITTRVGNALRRILRREPVELGDYLDPNFVHMFTEDQVRAEFEAAGFELRSFSATPYGHAVGVAVTSVVAGGAG